MSDKEISQLIIASLVNLAAIGYLVNRSWAGNDKSIILVIFLYPGLIVVNSILWAVSGSKAYKVTTIYLLILFLPVLLIATTY